jgi:large subunit ribosomal protein L21
MPFIIKSGSRQYTVKAGQKFIVDRLKADVDTIVELPVIYAYGEVSPTKTVKAKVLAHQKGIKIRVVKYKSKSNYHKQNGYRHYETTLEIVGDYNGNNSNSGVVELTKPVKAEKVVNEVEVTPEVVKKPRATKKVANPDIDDLKKIEGIGPKIEKLLNEGEITTFKSLSTTEVSRIQEILDAAGKSFSTHNPATWPKQAALAANGEWETLHKLQEELNGGKE